MLGSFIYDQWTFALPLYMESLYENNGAKYFGFLSSFNGLVVILFTPFITYLLRMMNELPKIMIGLFLFSLSYLIISDTKVYWIFFIMMFLFTIGEIVNIIGSASYVSRRVPASHRGRINSYRFIFYFIGGVGGRVIIGFLIDKFSYQLAFTTLGVVGIIAAIIVALNYKLDLKIFPKLYSKNDLDKATGVSQI